MQHPDSSNECLLYGSSDDIKLMILTFSGDLLVVMSKMQALHQQNYFHKTYTTMTPLQHILNFTNHSTQEKHDCKDLTCTCTLPTTTTKKDNI
jgi:hypothetical protein